MADLSCGVDLGFVETVEPWKLLSHFFPSKVGGKPAWLALDPLPKADQLRCGNCGKICVFLMQVYAPPADQLNPTAFHRTLFIFICKDPKCSMPNRTDNLIVFRSQLGKKNGFYSEVPPNEDDFDVNSSDYPKASDHQTLCEVCGCLGQWQCGKCKQVSYCDKIHQAAHWKAGHKQCCGNNGKLGAACTTDLLFKELSLEMEPEEEDESEDFEKSEADAMAEYEKIAGTLKAKETSQLSAEELEQVAGKSKEDTKFLEFQRIIAKDPEQVVRYERAGKPLWVTDVHIPEPSDIPPCEFCHSSRHFEFQVMSTLLPHVIEDTVESSIDWGTLIVYSCSRSCSEGGNYGKEFIWKQDFVN